MDAKEKEIALQILKKYENNWDHYAEQEYSPDRIILAMEEYSQLKAKERYNEAIRLFAEEYLEVGLSINDFPMTVKAIYVAAFGKPDKE